MRNFLSVDGGIYSILSKIFDLLLISILWVICCIPIVTAGASTTALYYSVVKVIRHDRGYLTKEFFKSFKANLKQGIILGVMAVLLWALLYLNTQITRQLPDKNIGNILFYAYCVVSLVGTFMALYIFPLLSRFSMKVTEYIQMALLISLKHLPTTIALSIIIAVAIILVVFIPPLLLIVPGAACYVFSFFMERILKKYTPKQDGEEAVDEWYLE